MDLVLNGDPFSSERQQKPIPIGESSLPCGSLSSAWGTTSLNSHCGRRGMSHHSFIPKCLGKLRIDVACLYSPNLILSSPIQKTSSTPKRLQSLTKPLNDGHAIKPTRLTALYFLSHGIQRMNWMKSP